MNRPDTPPNLPTSDSEFEHLLSERLAARAETISIGSSAPQLSVAAQPAEPKRRHSSRWLAAAAVVAVLVGGGALATKGADPVQVGTGSQPAAAAKAAIVYMQSDSSQAERDAVEAALRSDPEVVEFTYLDSEASWTLYQEIFADEPIGDILMPGEVPTSFRIHVSPTSNAAGFNARYRAMSGVYDVEVDLNWPLLPPPTVPPQFAQYPKAPQVIDLPTSIDAPEGRWLISKEPPGTEGPSEAKILLLDNQSGEVLHSFPFPYLDPHGLFLTEDALYCLRQGDGGVPDALVCRIDRRTFELKVQVLLHSGIESDAETIAPLVPSSWSITTGPTNAPFRSLALRRDGVLEASGQGPSFLMDATTLAPLGIGECERPADPTDQRLDPNSDLQLARVLGWQSVTRTLTYDPVGWGGPSDGVDFSVPNDTEEAREAPVGPEVDVWLALTGDGDPDLDRSDDGGIALLAAPNSYKLAWLSFFGGSATMICEQYTP